VIGAEDLTLERTKGLQYAVSPKKQKIAVLVLDSQEPTHSRKQAAGALFEEVN